MVRAVIKRCRDAVPEAPGALYLRPIIFGTTAKYRRGNDTDHRGDAGRARESGVGLLCGRRETACESSSMIRTRVRRSTWAR